MIAARNKAIFTRMLFYHETLNVSLAKLSVFIVIHLCRLPIKLYVSLQNEFKKISFMIAKGLNVIYHDQRESSIAP